MAPVVLAPARRCPWSRTIAGPALHWSAPPGVFAPVILTGYQFATTNGWLRFGRSRNRAPHEGESPLGAFVSERLGLDLLPRVAPSSAAGADVSARSGLRAAQATAVDRILDGPGEPSAFDITLITDYLANIASFRRVGDDPVEDGDARRVLRIVDDRRVNLLQPTTLAVKLAVRDQPATAVAFADRSVRPSRRAAGDAGGRRARALVRADPHRDRGARHAAGRGHGTASGDRGRADARSRSADRREQPSEGISTCSGRRSCRRSSP